jgi:Tfp pilus assembly protein PilV
MSFEKGQSLIELVIAIGIFVIIVSSLAILMFNSYDTGRLAAEITQANFLAEEGLEITRSIRDNNWQDLTNLSDTIDGKFNRFVSIEDIGIDRKKITSRVTWQFTEQKSQEVQLITYLTNWAKEAPYLAQLHYRWRNDNGGE